MGSQPRHRHVKCQAGCLHRLVKPRETLPRRNIGEDLKEADNGVLACRSRLRVSFPLDRDFLAGWWPAGKGAAPWPHPSGELAPGHNPHTVALPEPNEASGSSNTPLIPAGTTTSSSLAFLLCNQDIASCSLTRRQVAGHRTAMCGGGTV